MGQVNSLGTGGTFMQDAKGFGLDGLDIASSARFWYEGRAASPVTTVYAFTKGNTNYRVDLKYTAQNKSLSCMKLARA